VFDTVRQGALRANTNLGIVGRMATKMTRRLTMRLDDALAEAIEAEAQLERRRPSEWARLALADLLEPIAQQSAPE
jgi:hypothetical protein